MIKLNLGSKYRKLPGFDNLDKMFGWYFQEGLPQYSDQSVDGITISHALMFLTPSELRTFAKEMNRVLKLELKLESIKVSFQKNLLKLV